MGSFLPEQPRRLRWQGHPFLAMVSPRTVSPAEDRDNGFGHIGEKKHRPTSSVWRCHRLSQVGALLLRPLAERFGSFSAPLRKGSSARACSLLREELEGDFPKRCFLLLSTPIRACFGRGAVLFMHHGLGECLFPARPTASPSQMLAPRPAPYSPRIWCPGVTLPWSCFQDWALHTSWKSRRGRASSSTQGFCVGKERRRKAGGRV